MLLFCVHLCRRFAASPCAAEAKEHCSHSAYVPHNGAHRTITSRGAEHRNRKTKPLPCRQRTPVAIHAPARSFRGMGESKPPCFWFFWHQKNIAPDAHRHRFKGSRLFLRTNAAVHRLFFGIFWAFLYQKNPPFVIALLNINKRQNLSLSKKTKSFFSKTLENMSA